MVYRDPAPTGSRGTRRRNGVGKENDLEREKERMLQIRKQRGERKKEKKKERKTRGNQAFVEQILVCHFIF